MAKAVIFDVDGTLIDTVDLHAQAWCDTFEAFGVPATFEDVRSQIGKGGDQLLPVFLPADTAAERLEELEAFRGRIFKDRYFPKATGFPGVRSLFERLKSEGLTIAVGSSCKGDELEEFTDLAGVTDLIDVTATSDDADRSKPSPDIFLAVLHKLDGMEPAECVVVGDSPYDAQAAGAAGIPAIGALCGGFQAELLRSAGAAEIYEGPADLLHRLAKSRLLSREQG